MRKNNFLEGSFISTIGIFACKIIGLLYVIPFYAMISTTGSALYSYAYSIYAVFLSLSTSGIPVAISKLVSEYNTQEYHHTKEKVYKIGSKLMIFLGVFFFLIMFIFAPFISKLIIGNAQVGNSIADVTSVIRNISTALLIVPLFSVTKGYLQGQKIMAPSSIANIIEQVVRVMIILGGCFITLKMFGMDEKIAIGISVFSATIGAFIAYLYLIIKIKRNERYLKRHETITRPEAKFSNHVILKQIIAYALPFIVIDLLKSSYGLVDTLTVVRTLSNLGYNGSIAEATFGVITTWGSKLTMIVIAISTGITISLIPNIASDLVEKNFKKISSKINQTLQILLFTTIPMTIGIAFLAQPIWVLFYSYDAISIEVFRLFIFTSISFSLFSVLLNIIQTMNKTKVAIATLLVSFLGNAILNIPMMYICHFLGLGGYQGATVSTLITQFVPSLFILFYLFKKYHIHYRDTCNNGVKILLSAFIMLLCLMIISLFFKINPMHKGMALLQVIIYTIVGAIIYLYFTLKSGVIKSLFGKKKRKA